MEKKYWIKAILSGVDDVLREELKQFCSDKRANFSAKNKWSKILLDKVRDMGYTDVAKIIEKRIAA